MTDEQRKAAEVMLKECWRLEARLAALREATAEAEEAVKRFREAWGEEPIEIEEP